MEKEIGYDKEKFEIFYAQYGAGDCNRPGTKEF